MNRLANWKGIENNCTVVRISIRQILIDYLIIFLHSLTIQRPACVNDSFPPSKDKNLVNIHGAERKKTDDLFSYQKAGDIF